MKSPEKWSLRASRRRNVRTGACERLQDLADLDGPFPLPQYRPGADRLQQHLLRRRRARRPSLAPAMLEGLKSPLPAIVFLIVATILAGKLCVLCQFPFPCEPPA